MYLKKHIGDEAYNKLTPEQKANIDAIDAAIKAAELKPELKAALEGLDFDALKAFKTDSEEFRDAIKSLSAKVESLKASEPTTGKKDEIVEVLKAADELLTKAQAKDFTGRVTLGKIKASNMTTTTAFVDPVYAPMPYRVANPYLSPLATLNVLQYANVMPLPVSVDGVQDNITWVNELPIDGDVDYTEEGALKNKVSWTHNEETAVGKTITGFVKVSNKMLRNVNWIANRIRTRLMQEIEQKRETELLNGAGTADKLTGITEFAPGYTTTLFNDSVKDPQTADVIVCMAGQIEQLNFSPTIAMLNPSDIRKMKLVKDANGQYVMPPFSTTNGTFIDSLQVVPNMKIAAGYALVGDLSKFNVAIPEDITIMVGFENDDFTKNFRTILGETTITCFVAANELGAFCYDSIATVKTAIAETPTV